MVLIENVAVLKSRGLDVVVDGLARAGYGCWWDVVSALAVGAPHLRERIWVVAVPYERMPELVGEPFSEPRVKMPRAGASTARGLIEMVPCATQKAAKAAMGAVKRADGVTWLESIDTPLFPTPSSSSYGSNRGGAAGRVGPIRHSLESMARSGEWPEAMPSFPTPTVGDSRNSRNATANRTPGGSHHNDTTLSDFTRMWPTPHGMSSPDAPRAGGPSGNELGNAVNNDQSMGQKLWPTATAHPRTHTPSSVHHGMQLANEVVIEEQRMFATPRSSDAERGGRGDLIQQVRGNKTTSAHGEQRVWPTPRSGSNRNSAKAMTSSTDNGRRSGGGNSSGPGLEQAVELASGVVPRELDGMAPEEIAPGVRAQMQRVFPTPRSRDWKGGDLSPNGHHTTLDSLPAVTRMWPTAADGLGDPGRSPQRTGGLNLRTAVAEVELVDDPTTGLLLSSIVSEAQGDAPRSSQSAGSLNCDWTEWLMSLPVGWTDLSCDDPVQLDWLSEYDIPRVLRDVADRKYRLMACGNTLVWKVAYTRLAHALMLLGEDVPTL